MIWPDVSRETSEQIARYCGMVRLAATSQNLVAAGTLDDLEQRHIADSLQLTTLIPINARDILDIGSGAGFPGLILAIAGGWRTILVEPRQLRATFLRTCVQELGLGSRVTVEGRKVERLAGTANVITARAVAPLSRLFEMAVHLTRQDTIWLLPKGKSAASELATAQQTWQGDFDIRPSRTDPEAGIVVARHVTRKDR